MVYDPILENTSTLSPALSGLENLKLENLLKFQYTLKAGTAVSRQQYQILGQADPMDLIFKGLPKPVRIAPYVIMNLSHNLNLKEQFLKKNKAELEFEGMKVALKLGNKQLELVKRSVPLVRNSTVPRFIKSMQEDKMK